MSPVGVAVVGCGNVSHQYLPQLTEFPDLRVVACADLDLTVAKERAGEYGIPVAGGVEEIVDHPEVELVVNLTIPAAHVDVSLAAVRAGKHVYSEKPFALDVAGAGSVLAEASARGARVGSAPDTFLGPGFQTAAQVVAEGGIGEPLSAIAMMQSPGPEQWHPSPEFFYLAGGGPLFDMGPYHLTALAVLFGPVTRAAAATRRAHDHRLIHAGPRAGTTFPVEVDTEVHAVLDFAGGQLASTVFSFDSPLLRGGFLEITGSEATLSMPNPNNFDGPVRLRRAGDEEWTSVPTPGVSAGRGSGVVDMVRALREDSEHRASGALAMHVVEVMNAITESAGRRVPVAVASTFDRPALLPADWDPYAASEAAEN